MNADYMSNKFRNDIADEIICMVVKKHPLISRVQLRRISSTMYRRLWKKED